LLVSTWDWFEGAIRLFVAISMGAGAVRGFRRARQQGFAASIPTGITTVLLLLYLVGGVLLVAGYFIFKAPQHAILFGIAAIVYFVGGFLAVANIGGYLESRLTRTVRWPG
jgi:hypothetical protein